MSPSLLKRPCRRYQRTGDALNHRWYHYQCSAWLLMRQCLGSALDSMWIRIQHFRSMQIRMRIRIQIQGEQFPNGPMQN